MSATNLGGSKYVMICVDDFLRFKIVRFLKKIDAAAALRNIIAEYITPPGLKIDSIRTDEGGEFEGEFQQVVDSHGITHEFKASSRAITRKAYHNAARDDRGCKLIDFWLRR